MNNYTALLEITVNVHEFALYTETCFGRVIENVIKYDLYVKSSRIFAHSIQLCTTFCYKNINDVCQVFKMLHYYTFFVDTLYIRYGSTSSMQWTFFYGKRVTRCKPSSEKLTG